MNGHLIENQAEFKLDAVSLLFTHVKLLVKLLAKFLKRDKLEFSDKSSQI